MAQRWGAVEMSEQGISYNSRHDAVLVATARKFTECHQLFSHYYQKDAQGYVEVAV
jgi:hypothetical protein